MPREALPSEGQEMTEPTLFACLALRARRGKTTTANRSGRPAGVIGVCSPAVSVLCLCVSMQHLLRYEARGQEANQRHGQISIALPMSAL